MATLDVKIYNNDTIERLAETVLEYTGFDINSKIDIVQIANFLGLNVYEKILENTSGYIKIEDKNRNIYINSLDSNKRKRFTIAHEIGHYLLHRALIEHNCDTLYRNTNSLNRDMIEIQANRCAAALLMPRAQVQKYYTELSNATYYEKVARMAEYFNVSAQAMDVRLLSLGLSK
jgi:Zn-dependent peptidase ImmA (M78 family)